MFGKLAHLMYRGRHAVLGTWVITLLAAHASRVPRMARRVARFALHFVEMVLAMELGMVALCGLDTGILRPAGLNLTGRSPEMDALAMAVYMAAPMAAWMRLRGHGWGHAAEMAGAMVVPFAGAVALRAAGLLSRAEMMAFGNDLMWIAMVGVILFRCGHYTGAPHKHGTPPAPVALEGAS